MEKKSQRNNKKRNTRQLIFRLAFFAFFVYVVISFTVMQVDISKRRVLLEDAQADLVNEEYINREITTLLNSGESTDYLLRIARDKLGLVFPDERVIIDFKRK